MDMSNLIFCPHTYKTVEIKIGLSQNQNCFKMQSNNNSDFHTYCETCADLGASFIAYYRQSVCNVI